jgi:hypothetical protein
MEEPPMKETRLLGAGCVYDFGLATSSLSGHARSQFAQKCYSLRVRRYNRDVYSIPALMNKLLGKVLIGGSSNTHKRIHLIQVK